MEGDFCPFWGDVRPIGKSFIFASLPSWCKQRQLSCFENKILCSVVCLVGLLNVHVVRLQTSNSLYFNC